MINSIMKVLEKCIRDDFWGEDSILVGAYAEQNCGAQLDFEGLDTFVDPYNKFIIPIGDRRFEITLKQV